jgi:hypothetical protein
MPPPLRRAARSVIEWRKGHEDRKGSGSKHGGVSSRPWLGDLDSNQDCPSQSRKFYR